MPNSIKIASTLLTIEVAGDRLLLMRYNLGPNAGSLGLGIGECAGENAALILPKEAALALAEAIAVEYKRMLLPLN